MGVTKTLVNSILRARGITAKFSVTSIDRGLGRIRTQLKNLQTDKSYVKAGLMGKASKPRDNARESRKNKVPAPLTNVQLGIIHEFGTSKIPARPFIRPAFEKQKAVYLELLKRMVRDSIYAGKMPYTRALGIIGAKMAADMKNYVTQGPQIPPPNQGYPDGGYWLEKVERGYWKAADRARRAAKKNKPVREGPQLPPRTLVDTGRMIGSLTFGVVARGTGDDK
jgi:hypothetical protein